MAEKKYMLEITMESNGYKGHKYIKRSFPAVKGKLDTERYGFPYNCYDFSITNVVDHLTLYDNYAVFPGGEVPVGVYVSFGGEQVFAPLHDFVTVRKVYAKVDIDAYRKAPKTVGEAEVYVTFYAYVE